MTYPFAARNEYKSRWIGLLRGYVQSVRWRAGAGSALQGKPTQSS
jgi:hypothetical protein